MNAWVCVSKTEAANASEYLVVMAARNLRGGMKFLEEWEGEQAFSYQQVEC